jgi:predicted PurR-regulated permease PerM
MRVPYGGNLQVMREWSCHPCPPESSSVEVTMTRNTPAFGRPRTRSTAQPRSNTPAPGESARAQDAPRRIQFDAFRLGLLGTLGVGVGMLILGAVQSLTTVLIYIGVAYFVALAIEPLIDFFMARRVPRWVASVVIVLVGGVAATLVALAIVPSVARQITVVIQGAPAFISSLPSQPWVQWITANVPNVLDVDRIIGEATAFISDPQRLLSLGGGLLSIGAGIGEGVTAVIVVTVLSLYFTLTLPSIMEKVYQTIPRSRRDGFRSVTDEILQSVGKYVAGQLLLALINAAVTFTVVIVVGGPAPLLLAFVAFVFALIPVVGPIIGTTIVVVATLVISPVGALIAAVILLVYMQVEAYFLSPKVMAKAVAVPGALVIIAAIGGAALGGILGALVAIPVVAAGILIFDRVVLPRQQLR